MFTRVADRFGNEYDLAEVSLLSARPFGGTHINTVPTQSCTAGYFTLFFAPNSIFATTAASLVVCEVFSNISGLIVSTTPPGAINIYCENDSFGLLASATSVKMYPNLPASSAPGIIDGFIYKYLTAGVDPYSLIPIASFNTNIPSANNFYHGRVTASATANWNFNMGIVNIASTEFDFYTAMLHETTHALGFSSAITLIGYSNLGIGNNYFERYDQFLKDKNGVALLTPTNIACPVSNLAFNSGLTPSNSVSQSICYGNNSDVTTCSLACKYVSANVTATVYTPFCFELPSSLSHFEDICSWGSFTTACTPTPSAGYNNLYYTMANSNSPGPCYVKRYLKEEERNVLCDLGYSTLITYTSNALGAPHTYSFGCAPTATIVGLNDGLSGTNYTYTTSTTSFTIPLNTLLSNDIPGGGLQVTCPEVVFGNGNVMVAAADLSVTAFQGAGIVLVKYIPYDPINNIYGNATYVFIHFLPGNCNPSNTCNMIQNPGFENLTAGPPCGPISQYFLNTAIVSCWENYSGLPELYSTNCTANSNMFNLGFNTNGLTSPPVYSYNGSGNTRAISVWSNIFSTSAIKNYLSTPLIPGQTYRLSFWAQNPIGTANINPNALPITISVVTPTNATSSLPFINFPLGLITLTQYTINPGNYWSLVTNTFVFPSTLTASPLITIGADYSNTSTIPQNTVLIECFIDDVNLELISGTTFALPQATICSGMSYTNLAQFTSTVLAGIFSGPGVSYNGQYHFNAAGTLTPGNYPIAFTYTNNTCSNTIWQNVVIQNTIAISASGNATYCATTGGSVNISASQTTTLPGISFNWQPGNLTGTLQSVSPTITTVYTVTASGANVCSVNQTLAINVFTNCCGTQTLTVFTPTNSVGSNTLYGPMLVTSDFTIQPGATVLWLSDFRFTSNARITVANNAALFLRSVHFSACGADMWQGVRVLDGAYLSSSQWIFGGTDNLLEDAITCIDASDQFTTSLSTVLDITNTTFNKNFTDIRLSNYQRTSNTYSSTAFNIRNNVFTCRTFTVNDALQQWPTTSQADLRLVGSTTPTSGLDAPYQLGISPFATLLAPYAGQTSNVAIEMHTVGINGSSAYYGIGLGSNTASEFNLFDNHCTFISAETSNLSIIKCVFQNTKLSAASPGNGSAIYYKTNSASFNGKLDLTGSSVATGNRFWNCHKAVEAKNTYYFKIENAIFRSTQSATATTGINPGNAGIVLNTNRFRYWIRNNEFTNINTCINIPLTAAVSTLIAPPCALCASVGIYAGNLTIQQNTFAPGSYSGGGSGTYINKAIELTGPLSANWNYAPAPSLTPAIMGVFIDNNVIKNAYRGIALTGLKALPARINDNTISLVEDNMLGMAQYGIGLYNCFANTGTYGKQVITGNFLKSVGSSTLTNNLTSLIHCGGNMGPGLQSPSVTCNAVQESFNGFEFEGPNQGTIWRGNDMQKLARGMLLNLGGVIGPQGGPSLVISNGWNGTWTSGTNYGIYTYTSNAGQSPLWVATANYPPNLDGLPNPLSFAAFSLAPVAVSGVPGYNCHVLTSIISNPQVPSPAQYWDDNSFWIAKYALYNYFWLNDSILNSNSDYSDFYDDLYGSNIEKFIRVEKALIEEDYSSASTVLSSISPTNSAESNSKAFYGLYATFAANRFEPTNATDKSNLESLTSLCPGADGACVYQSRALYNSVFGTPSNSSLCGEFGSRTPNLNSDTKIKEPWSLKTYPNPASHQLILESSIENDDLRLQISDLSGEFCLQII